jgi:hypothetical protein
MAATSLQLGSCVKASAGERRINVAHCKAELRKCDPVRGTCIFVGFPVDSDCDTACKAKLITRVEELVPTMPMVAYAPSKFHGCVGYRVDIGGNEYGARCLAKALGYRYEPDGCHDAGWAYSIIAQ